MDRVRHIRPKVPSWMLTMDVEVQPMTSPLQRRTFPNTLLLNSQKSASNACQNGSRMTDTRETHRSVEVLRMHSEKWFEIVASVLIKSNTIRGPNLLCALSELASISTPTVLNTLFTDAKNRLFQVTHGSVQNCSAQSRTCSLSRKPRRTVSSSRWSPSISCLPLLPT